MQHQLLYLMYCDMDMFTEKKLFIILLLQVDYGVSCPEKWTPCHSTVGRKSSSRSALHDSVRGSMMSRVIRYNIYQSLLIMVIVIDVALYYKGFPIGGAS